MSKTIRTLLLCIVALSFGTRATAQEPFTLSGTVYGGGAPLANTTVEALQDGTTTVVASTATTTTGQFSLALPPATYDLRVTPPAGSGYGQATVQDVVMNMDRQQDVILLSTGSGSLSGTLTGHQGLPVPGASVTIQSMPAFTTVVTLQTDSLGRYTTGLSPGTYRVFFSGSNRPNAPPSFNWDRRDVVVSGTTTLDVALPVVRVTGTVTANGSPVPSTNVQGSSNVSANPVFTSSFFNIATASDGTFSSLLLTGTASMTVRPPASAGLQTVTATFSLTADAVRDFALEPLVASGVLRGYNGQPIPSANFSVYTTSFQFLLSGTTNALGEFSLPLDPGTYRLTFNGFNRPNSPMSWSWDNRAFVLGEGPTDVQLPVVRLTGSVVDGSQSPVANTVVRFSGNTNVNTTLFFNSNGQHTANALGQFDVFAFTHPTTIWAAPPTGSPFGLASAVYDLTADRAITLVVPDDLRITGTLRGYGGQPVQSASVTLLQSPGFGTVATTSTDANGAYSLPAALGTFRLIVGLPNRPNITPSGSWDNRALSIAGPTTMDIDLPVVKLTGRVLDANGVGVPAVAINGSSNLNNSATQRFQSSSASTTTSSTGTYSLLLLAGTANISFLPPSASGFTGGVLSNISLTTDINQAVVLQRPDTTAPTIVSGPSVIHLSDTSVSVAWTTDEPATSSVSYGVGGLTQTISDNTPVTTHSVTLLNLEPLATHTYQVSSADQYGNGPTTSQVAFFTTLDPPGDITPPVITDGPTVAFVDQTTAIIQWTTDEPATSGLEYGETPELGTSVPIVLGQFRQTHSVRLTGLTPAATYFLRTTSQDPDDNSTSSAVFTLTTLTVPDTQAPVLVEGPTATSITDTRMTITWRTDEPSTSGVSYNDGTTFNVVNDGAFVRQHSVTLTSLRPQTQYQITVSSVDAVGNGPTLGGPISATTQPTPDVIAPVISGVNVIDIGETTATVVWVTDEPASSLVVFGTTPGAETDSKGSVALVVEHRVVLTGLRDGTTYYASIRSQDAAGNGRTSDTSFETQPTFVDTPPTAPGTPSASPNPSRTGAFVVSWSASTDDVGVTAYDVLLGETVLGSVDGATTTFAASGVAEGSHLVRVRARDGSAQATTSNGATVIVDRTAPTLEVPDDVTVDAVSPSGADVEFSVIVSDNFDVQPVVTCSSTSGRLPLGTTTVSCTATDAAGNATSDSFDITVRDAVAPTLTLPADITTNATGPDGAVVSFAVSATDSVDPTPTVTCDRAAGSTFPVGQTTVTCRAVDAAGNMSPEASFTVTVEGASAQMGQTAELIAGFALPAEVADALLVKLDQALTAPTTTSACGTLQALINSTEAQRRARKITAAQAEAIITATVQIMVVQGCQ